MFMKWAAAFTAAIVMAQTAIADVGCFPGRCDAVTIERIFIVNDGLVYLETTGDETAIGCTPYSSNRIALNTNAAGSDRLFAAIMAAYQQQSSLTRIFMVSSSPAQSCDIESIRFPQNGF